MGTDRRMLQRLLRLTTLLAASLVIVAAVQPEPMTMAIAGIAALTVATALGARYLAVVVTMHLVCVGDRASEHTEGLSETPAPRHPNTPGRRRSRAPSPSAAVT